MIPNEKLAGGVLKNDTLVVDVVSLDVSVWVPPETDVEAAIGALEDETQQEVTIAEAVPWGTRLSVGSDPVAPPDRAPRARQRCAANVSRVCEKKVCFGPDRTRLGVRP